MLDAVLTAAGYPADHHAPASRLHGLTVLMPGSRWLFLYPGLLSFVLGVAAMAWLLPVPDEAIDIHALFYAALAVIAGFHAMLFWVIARLRAVRRGLVPADPRFQALLRTVTLEIGLLIGLVLLVVGLVLGGAVVLSLGSAAFGPVLPESTMRLVIPAGTALLLAFQIAYGSSFVSMLEIRASRRGTSHSLNPPWPQKMP